MHKGPRIASRKQRSANLVHRHPTAGKDERCKTRCSLTGKKDILFGAGERLKASHHPLAASPGSTAGGGASWRGPGVQTALAYSISEDKTGAGSQSLTPPVSGVSLFGSLPSAAGTVQTERRPQHSLSGASGSEGQKERKEGGEDASAQREWTESEKEQLLASSLGFFPGGIRSFFFPKGDLGIPMETARGERSDGSAPPVLYTLTPEDDRALIRSQRLAYKANPREACVNDSLRRAALGPERYARLVEKKAELPSAGHGGENKDQKTAEEHSLLTPVWMMRQAGRYLPEFRNMRRQHGFLEVCRDPRLASELTLQPYHRFPQLDAVIIFSDILVIPEAMGMKLSMEEGVGPRFAWRIESPADIKKLTLKPDIENTLGYVFDAVYVTSQRLAGGIPLIGFCGGPLTLLTYMVEGGGSKTWRRAKKFIYEEPEATHTLLQVISDICVDYLVGQADAGAQVLQVFDTNASQFAADTYDEIGAPFLASIAERVKERRPHVTMIAFPKDRPSPVFADSAFDVISLGSSAEIDSMQRRFSGRRETGKSGEAAEGAESRGTCSGEAGERRDRDNGERADGKALQGNLDPQILYTDIATIKRETAKMIRRFGVGRHIANLGHGMEPEMSPEHAQAFIESVKEASAAYLREREAREENSV
ncbi:uroporphyrinogen decarboxylase,related [Neospora caninum Liverpool]|uniref:uroporphyrinogen decarboxylase n=1 Tax=Neospora caninum (strain Liverpool) TaxID=572307 RepID=F0VC29_NEOCL|nr:uroporphyrinogen decarboxylase,related [Neospora caninum Liverpool]CBZ51163.1 uroporphyrinogen decarboxylase,related [Neospora caninum Liverpool]|eukprot:XP_003881196.1 uroporphyrinogen decarboxylase,related [Neospora caninum Liverpool]